MFFINLMVNYDQTLPKLDAFINILMKNKHFEQILWFKGEFGRVRVNDQRENMDQNIGPFTRKLHLST
jgi:hypothetical protein